MGEDSPVLVLASASAVRKTLLENAGLEILTKPTAIDEKEIKAALKVEGASAAQAAETLAELKAQRVAAGHAGALVIGCDQLLDCEGVWFDKPTDRATAAAQLATLAGRSHVLETAVCVVHDGHRIWHHNARATVTLRRLPEATIARYLEAVGAAALDSVGAYQLEGLGAQLIEQVEGDFFTVLGLPLLPLLQFLRDRGALPR
ncbi:MAG: Maf family nucleotide pyrophosphatase [Kiloniellales bacterium]